MGVDMALTINATAGTQVEGLHVNDALQNRLWGTATEWDLVTTQAAYLKNYYALQLSVQDGIPLTEAATFVEQNTTRVE